MRDRMGEWGVAGGSPGVQRPREPGTPKSESRRGCPSSRREREKIHPFSSFFVLFRP